jgi:hypothetical protein
MTGPVFKPKMGGQGTVTPPATKEAEVVKIDHFTLTEEAKKPPNRPEKP